MAALVVALVLLVFAWRIVTQTAADSLTLRAPEQALTWRSNDAEALSNEARAILDRRLTRPTARSLIEPHPPTLLTAEELRQAGDLSQRALQHDPLWGPALTNLALVAEGQGDEARAQALMTMAASRRLREATAQEWLFGRALRRGDFAEAAQRLDILLRSQPGAQTAVVNTAAALLVVPAFQDALATAMSEAPPWRKTVLQALSTLVTDPAVLRQFVSKLRGGPRPVTEDELQPYVARLVRDNAFSDAFAVWSGSLPLERRRDLAFFNADFAFPPGGSEFDWKILPAPGFDVSWAKDEDRTGRILRLGFSGTRIAVSNISHLLMLPAGRYELSGDESAEALRTSRGLGWRIACATKLDQTLGQGGLLTGTVPWRHFAMGFEVPTAGCSAQVLRLELPARVALEQDIAGEAAYRRLSINPSK